MKAIPALAALSFGLSLAAHAAAPAPGAYCPLPEAGEKPVCLEPAVSEYAEFFSGVDGGGLDDAQAARLEADVAAGAASDRPYLALSSLSYGYYQLARQASRQTQADPAVVERLERWNALLTGAYRASADDERYRDAIRTAAVDLQQRAPAVELDCLGPDGQPTRCQGVEAVLNSLQRGREETGVRGALRRFVDRWFNSGGS